MYTVNVNRPRNVYLFNCDLVLKVGPFLTQNNVLAKMLEMARNSF